MDVYENNLYLVHQPHKDRLRFMSKIARGYFEWMLVSEIEDHEALARMLFLNGLIGPIPPGGSVKLEGEAYLSVKGYLSL